MRCELKRVENIRHIPSDNRMAEKQKNDLPGGAEDDHNNKPQSERLVAWLRF
jgi:hypothetical protein